MSDLGSSLVELMKKNYAPAIAEHALLPEAICIDADEHAVLFVQYAGWSQEEEAHEKLIWSLVQLAAGVPCGSIAYVSDVYGVRTPTKTDGSEWAPGDIGRAFENDTVDKPLVHEALVVVLVFVDGQSEIWECPYERREGEIVWLGDRQSMTADDDAGRNEGAVVQAIREGFANRKSLYQLVQGTQYEGIDPITAGIYQTVTSGRLVQNAVDCAVGFADSSPAVMEVIKQVYSQDDIGITKIDAEGRHDPDES